MPPGSFILHGGGINTKSRALSLAICLLMITTISASFTQNVGQSSSTLGGTIYVDDDNISGIEDGTIAHPYNTIQEGVNAASYGDTIYVFNGTYQENVIIDKSLILQGEDKENTIIDGGGIGSVVEITAPSVELTRFKVQNTGTTFSDSGVKIDSNNNLISDVLSEETYRGVYVHSDNNFVKNIVCINNGNYGIEVNGDWNRIINCITNNTGTFGIFIRKGDYNHIRDSYSTLNHLGFQIMHGKFNKIENCTAYDNNYGIRFHASVYNCCIAESSCINNGVGILLEMEVNNNTITGCLLENNGYGIWIREYIEYYIPYPSINNLIHHNIFMGNTIQAYDSYSNYWDNGYPAGGNYWCDYSGVDLYNGPNQDIIGSDGIGDTPYTFSNGQDNYPLMNPGMNGNIKPVADAGSDQTVYVGEIVQFNGSDSYDPDGTINFYLWNFGDGTSQKIGISPSHIFNNSGNFTVILEVIDNNCSTDTDTCIINVLEEDSLPIANAGPDQTINEGSPVQFDASASYDQDGTIESYEWDFNSSDGLWWETGAVPDATGPTPTHIYGDDGVYIVTLRVTDNHNLSAIDTCNVTVQNVNPTVTIESITMNYEIGLRVAGRKYNDVGMTLYENGVPIGYISIERLPGSPDDQMSWIPVSINFSCSYNATVIYTPEDPLNVGGNPVWIYIKSLNGSIKKIHHTFNVQQSKKRDSEHWNHVEPWEVDLNGHFIGLPFEITSHITDPGSDDETLTFTYGSQVKTVTYLNNPPNPDLYPSPEINPVDIMDTTTLVYEGPGTVTLVVKDDDNIRLGVGEGTDSVGV